MRLGILVLESFNGKKKFGYAGHCIRFPSLPTAY